MIFTTYSLHVAKGVDTTVNLATAPIQLAVNACLITVGAGVVARQSWDENNMNQRTLNLMRALFIIACAIVNALYLWGRDTALPTIKGHWQNRETYAAIAREIRGMVRDEYVCIMRDVDSAIALIDTKLESFAQAVASLPVVVATRSFASNEFNNFICAVITAQHSE